MEKNAGKGDKILLSGRLQMLADMVTQGNRVADVGCDHGFLAIYLVQQGISPSVIAADLREGPLSGAREHVTERGLEAYIELRLSDGLTMFSPGEADTLVCAGMGGRLMQKILSENREMAGSFRELILQPQSELREFRIFLREESYRVVGEDILWEDGQYYFGMKAVPALHSDTSEVRSVPRELADRYGELLLRERHPVLKEYLEFMRDVNCRTAEQIGRQAGKTERTERRLAEIYLELSYIREALEFYTGKRGEMYEHGYSDSRGCGKAVSGGDYL